MKKTFNNFRTLAALLMAGAAFAACSSDDNIIEQQPANPGEQVYTLTINASKGDGTTRALDLDGTKLVASWTNGDVLTVFNLTKSEALTGTLTASNASGSTATFSGALNGTIEVGDKLELSYNNVAFSDYANQDGTLKGTNGAEKYDCATAEVTVASVDAGNITTTGDANFTTWTAMLKLTLQDNAATPNKLNATSLSISVSGIGVLWTFSPTAATYAATTNGDGILYFALPCAEDVAYWKGTTTDALEAATVTFTATVGGNTYTATKPGYKFADGTYYAATLTMAAAPAYTMAAAATDADKGKLICTDGHIHANGADAACTKARVAKIIYVGTTGDATYSHGLALALEDVSSNTLSWDNSGYDNNSKTAAEWCNAWNTSKNVTGATWLLASKDQWNYMLGASGAGSHTALRDGFSGIAGASNMTTDVYWSSTESESSKAWCLGFSSGDWYRSWKDFDHYVRACLAF